MSMVQLEDYYSAGYFLIRKNRPPDWLNEPHELLPNEIISLESEFCPKFHLSWGLNSDDHAEALTFGINEAKWAEFEEWCTYHHDKEIEVWSMFRSTTSARNFVKHFIPESKRNGLLVIGVGLHQSCEVDWKEPDGTEGVELRILKHLQMEQGGQNLGFDVASYAHHNFDHTWFSHGHHKGVFQELGIRPENYGLLQTREQSILARDYTNANDGYVYEHWLLVSYPLELAR